MPSARSMLGEPLEKLSISRSMPSPPIVRMAPLPNCFSIVEPASAIAFSRSDSPGPGLPRVLVVVWLAMVSILLDCLVSGVMRLRRTTAACPAERHSLERGVTRAGAVQLAFEQHRLRHDEFRRRHGQPGE